MGNNPIIQEPHYVIPDNPNGIDLSYQTFNGNLYGIESLITGYANLKRIRVIGNSELERFKVHYSNEITNEDSDINGVFNIDYGEFLGFVNLSSAEINILKMNHTYFHKKLTLDSLAGQNDQSGDQPDVLIIANGIYAYAISAQKINGDWRCKGSTISGDLNLKDSSFTEENLCLTNIEGTLNLENNFGVKFFTYGGCINQINLNNASFDFWDLSDLRIHNCLGFENLDVDFYMMNGDVHIPSELNDYLNKKGKRVSTFMEYQNQS